MSVFNPAQTNCTFIYQYALAMATTALVLAPRAAFAHVKWFVEDPHSSNNEMLYGLTDTPVLIFTALAVIAIIAGYILTDYTETPQFFVDFGKRNRDNILRFVQILIGVPFVLSASQGAIIASHIQIGSYDPDWVWVVLCILEMVAGVLLIANIMVRYVAVLSTIMFFGLFGFFGIVPTLEYLGVLALTFYVSLLAVPESNPLFAYKAWSVQVLRIIFGVSLITLGFTEKLLNPGLARQFLSTYHWNFMEYIGLTYPDDLFILSAAIVEITVGIFLVLGMFTRTVSLVLFALLMTSNITFFIFADYQESLEELLGHSLLFASLLILIIFGRARHGTHVLHPFKKREQATA